jgi:hypothetical protein
LAPYWKARQRGIPRLPAPQRNTPQQGQGEDMGGETPRRRSSCLELLSLASQTVQYTSSGLAQS